MNREKLNTVIGWVLTGVVALILWLNGVGKLMNSPAAIAEFEHWGYSRLFMYTVGTLEVFAGLFLVAPQMSIYGAFLVIILMLGAVVTHILHDPVINVLRPVAIIVFTLMVMRIRGLRLGRVKQETESHVTVDA